MIPCVLPEAAPPSSVSSASPASADATSPLPTTTRLNPAPSVWLSVAHMQTSNSRYKSEGGGQTDVQARKVGPQGQARSNRAHLHAGHTHARARARTHTRTRTHMQDDRSADTRPGMFLTHNHTHSLSHTPLHSHTHTHAG